MADPSGLNDAITAFQCWERPWEFPNFVATAIGLSLVDRERFARAWDVATDGIHWQTSDLSAASQAAKCYLRDKFPFLSEDAAGAIARAASYDWK